MTMTPLSAMAASLPLPNASIKPPNGFLLFEFSSDSALAFDPISIPAAFAAALLTMVCGAPVSSSAGNVTPLSVTSTARSPHASSRSGAVTSPSSAPASQSYSW